MTAKKYDTGKPKLSLIPSEPLMDLARVFMFGAEKYGKGNWRSGFDYSRLYDAVMRHLMAWFEGEDMDPESGLPHLSHATWGLIILRYFQIKGEGTDDRNKGNINREKMPVMPGNESNIAVLSEQNQKKGLGVSGLLHEAEPAVQEKRPVERKGKTLKELQADVVSWANEVIPDRHPQATFNKLVFEEIPELVNGGLKDPLEFADILILVLDLAHLAGVDAEKALTAKMFINRQRKWVVNPDTGLMSHVESQYSGETEEPE